VQVSYHDENIPHHVNFDLLQTNNRESCVENGIQSIASEEYYEAIRSLKGVSITVAFNGKTDVLEQGTSE